MSTSDAFLAYPRSPFKIAWDLTVSTAIVVVALRAPYQIVLQEMRYDGLYWLVTALLCADVLLRFNTPFYRLRTLVTDRKLIAARYLRSWFAVDLLYALPLGPLLLPCCGGEAAPAWLANVLFLQRVPAISRLNAQLRVLERVFTASPAIMRLASFLFWFVFAAHGMALGWIAIGAAAGIEKDLGIIQNLSDPVPHVERYVRALYFITTTMATIGYGDVVPHKDRMWELLYTIFLQLTGVGMYGYVIGNVSSLLGNLDVARASFRRHTEEINAFMRRKKLPPALQDRVRDYFEYMWESHQSTGADQLGHDSIIDRLPASIALDMRLFLTGEILQKVPFFKQAGETFIREIVTQLEGHVFLPGDYLMRRGELGDCMYFINTGEFEVILDGEEVVARLDAGSHVGEMSLVFGGTRNASVRAVTFCEVYRLSRESFDGMRRRHPDFDAQIREVVASREAANKK
ncbi:MAG: cyclic nucleotide-binding domain-containing protein [Planctomycetes bacterium]|nr:cyclic nucleotide-binding domain-containing protein [Planctomycetota bacterium]